MKVAIVHDWFVGWGAESVVYELHKMYPDAPIYTAYCNDEWRARLAPAKVITSYMQHWPFSRLRKFLPALRAMWFSRLDLTSYDLVISSSGAEAKGIKVGSGKWKMENGNSDVKRPLHINYCHSPTHYYWSRYEDYLREPGFGSFDWLARIGLKLLVGPLRKWDYKAAQRPDVMVANSNHTRAMIKKYYGRDSIVIHPPVEIERFQRAQSNKPKAKSSRQGFVTAGRQVPYKRIDLAIRACGQLKLPLLVLGSGPDYKKLKRLAGRNVTFIKHPSAEQMAHYFQTSLAFIFPGVDDFGIVAVEALAAGTPVIAYGAGGALDYVNKTTGLLFKEQTANSLAKAIQDFNKLSFDHAKIAAAAEEFSTSKFHTSFQQFIKSLPKNG